MDYWVTLPVIKISRFSIYCLFHPHNSLFMKVVFPFYEEEAETQSG